MIAMFSNDTNKLQNSKIPSLLQQSYTNRKSIPSNLVIYQTLLQLVLYKKLEVLTSPLQISSLQLSFIFLRTGRNKHVPQCEVAFPQQPDFK